MASYSTLPADPDASLAPGTRDRTGWRLVLLAGLVGILLWQESRALTALHEAASPGWRDRLAVPGLLVGLGLLGGRAWSWALVALLGGIVSFLLVGDRAFLAYFHHPLSVEMGVAAGQFWDVRHSTASLVSWSDWGALAAVVVCALLLATLDMTSKARSLGRILGVLLLAMAASTVARALPGEEATHIVKGHGFARKYVTQHGLLMFHARDAARALQRRLAAGELEPATRESILGTFGRRKLLNDTPSPLFGIAEGRNVVFVQVEALQSFAWDWVGPEGPVAPRLVTLAQGGLFFDRCMDTTGLGRTSSAEFQVLTGLPSHSLMPEAFTHMGQRYTTLASELVGRGYETLSLHAYKRGFWNRAVAHPTYGIGSLVFEGDWRPAGRLGWGLADVPFLQQVAERLAALAEPFFALAITLSCHHPFTAVPKDLRDWPTGLDDDLMAANYLRLVHYTDRAVGLFLRRMRELGLAEKTLFVIYGDHDAGLDPLSRQAIAEATGADPGHPAEDRLPLLILVPGQEAALRRHAPAYRETYGGLHDIAPTVLHLLGLPSPVGFLGTHLFVPPAERALMSLPNGAGYVEDNVLHDAWGEVDPPAAPGAGGRDRAATAVLLADLVLDHGLQAVAASTPVEQLPVDGAPLGVLGLSPHGRTWTRHDADPWPLPGGSRLLDAMPTAVDPLFTLVLAVTNGADVDQPYRLRGFDAAGRQVLLREGLLGAGERAELHLAPGDPRDAGEAAYALLDAPSPVSAVALLQHFRGLVQRPLVERFSERTSFEGDAAPVAAAGVLLTSFADEERTVMIEVRAEDHGRRIPVKLPPRGYVGQQIPLMNLSGPVTITVVGDDVASSLLCAAPDGSLTD